MEENRKIDIESEELLGITSDDEDIQNGERGVSDGEVAENSAVSEREEYERLIKNRFKELYAEDTQRLINRRFRKYKVMEERFRLLEETLAERESLINDNLQKIADFEFVLRAEVEKAVKETEERVISEIRAKQIRPSENGSLPRAAQLPFDVSRLTKSERATLAKRAAGGEKIKF